MEMLGQALAFSQLQARIATEGIVCTYDRAGKALLKRLNSSLAEP